MNKSIRSFNQSAQAGFTLIELIVVIVILGILAATAVPKFIDMASQARVAKMNATRGAVQSASALAHSQSLINGTDSAATGSVTMEGATVAMAYGYPTSAGIVAALNLSTSDYISTATATAATITDNPARTNCQVVYTASAAVNTPPTIAATTSGC